MESLTTNVQKLIRTGITMFPSMADRKADLQRAFRRALRRPFEEDFRALSELLHEGDHCIDVGANRGQSIDALKMSVPSLRITALEPQPDLYDRLVCRYADDPLVRVLPVAASSAAANFDLFVPSYNGYRFDGLASLYEREAREWLESRIFRFNPRKLIIQPMPCKTVRLDDLELERPIAFIKMDIQGAELSALQGSQAILRHDHPCLLIESPSAEIDSFLSNLGYEPRAYVNGRLEPGRHGGLNTFFISDQAEAKSKR